MRTGVPYDDDDHTLALLQSSVRFAPHKTLHFENLANGTRGYKYDEDGIDQRSTMFGYSVLLVFFSALGLASTQDLGVPLSWREFSNSRPLSERITISQNAINELIPQLNSATGEFNGIGFWQSGNVWSAMANHDHFAGTNTYQSQVVDNLKNVFNLRANYDEYGWWATAAYYGYRAYGDTTLLANAVATWNHVTNYVITPSQASAGQTPVKSFTLSRAPVTVLPWPEESFGLYITLSAFLADATKDSKYTNAAIASTNWIKSLNLNSNNLVLDTVNGHDCSRSPDWIFTYNSGKFIEGLSILADVSGDSQWRDLMINIAAVAMKNPPWQGSNGVITEGASPDSNNDGVGFKSVLIRGLLEAYVRNPGNNDFRILIHSYVDVQYNALLELAANGNTYSSSWPGPPQGFTSWGQLAALDVMVAAIVAN